MRERSLGYLEKSAVALGAAIAIGGCADSGPKEAGSGGGAGGGTGSRQWELPECPSPSGIGIEFHYFSEGGSISAAPPAESCNQIVPLQEANVLLAICDYAKLYRSTDAGCTWELFDDSCSYNTITAAPEFGAYGMCLQAGAATVARVEGDEISYFTSVDQQHGRLVVDPADRNRLLLFNVNETLLRSEDGGESWELVASLPSAGEYPGARDVVADPDDFGHAVFTDWDSVWVTTDAGQSFTQSTFEFDDETYGDAYISRLAMAPSNPQLVYAVGRVENTAGELIEESNGVYLSEDGGLTFALTPWPVGPYHSLFADPADERSYLFIELLGGDGMDQGPTNANLVRVESGASTAIHANEPLSSLAFSPADPDLVYIGLTAPFP